MEPTREQLDALARQLAATAPEEIDCEAVFDLVAAYVEAMQGDAVLSPELQKVAQHLEVCPYCCEDLQALLRAIASE